MDSLIDVLLILTQAIFYLVLVQLILGLLIQFEVANPRNPLVQNIYYGVGRLLDPVLNPIRRILPSTGGIDFSPMVLLIGLQILIAVLNNNR